MMDLFKKYKFDIYLIILSTLTFISYVFNFEYLVVAVFLIVGIYTVVLNKNPLNLIPIVMLSHMGNQNLSNEATTLKTALMVITIVLIVADAIKNRKFTTKGKLFYPFMIFIGLSILTFINSDDYKNTWYGLLQVLRFTATYMYLVNVLRDDKDNFINISKVFLYSSLVVTAEMLYVINDSAEPILNIIRSRQINLGWANLNVIIYPNLVSIPLVAYLVLNAKAKIYYMVLGSFSALGIFLTLSRSSILTLFVYALLLGVLILVFYRKDIKKLILPGIIYVIITGLTMLYFEQDGIISGVINSFLDRDLGRFDDRFVLIERGIELFKEHPLFGFGGLYSSRIHLAEFGIKNYHNTFVQAMTLGVFGLLNLFYFMYEQVRVVVKEKDLFKYFILIMLFGTGIVNGFFQPMYFYADYILFIAIFIALFEVRKQGN